MKSILTAGTLLLSLFTFGQLVKTPGVDYQESKLGDSTTIGIYTSIQTPENDGVRILNPIFKNSINTGYPRGYNDGPVWKGKGLTSELHGGFALKKGGLSVTMQPVMYFSQNADFDLTPQLSNSKSLYSYQFAGGIDWVQRYGKDPFFAFSPGQSEIRYTLDKFTVSASTQNISFGPAVFNPIILSNQAAGIPHLELGTTPIDISIKEKEIITVEGRILYGLLRESQYFNDDDSDNLRYFGALSFGIIPTAVLPNLKLGFHKGLFNYTEYFDPEDLLAPIMVPENDDLTNVTNDSYDQLASVSIDWSFPAVGFRAYAEYAKNDFTGYKRWTLLEPEHSRAYTIGFEKLTEFKNGNELSIIYEHNNLSRNHTYLWRPEPTFYVHHINRQGYTNNGQIAGAGVGPGGVNDQLSLLFKTEKNWFGLMVQRIEHDKDYFVSNLRDTNLHSVEYTTGVYYKRSFNQFDISLDLAHSKTLNRYYIQYNDQKNLYCSVSIVGKLQD